MINHFTNEIESFTFLRWKINNANHMKTSCEFSTIMQKKEIVRKNQRNFFCDTVKLKIMKNARKKEMWLL
jgi:hypothetical protein